MKYDWSKERIAAVIKDCDSLSQVLDMLGIPRAGNNTATLRNKLEEYGIDYSHFTFGAKQRKKVENYIPVAEYLGTGKYISTSNLKDKLFREGLKKNECENPKCPCKEGYWLDHPLVCQLHHINGDHTDNRLENLQILCPNCHSQTNNYCGNANKAPKYFCTLCGKEKKSKNSKYCFSCASKLKKNHKPSMQVFISKFKELRSYTQMGQFYQVSDATIRKWSQSFGLPTDIKELLNCLDTNNFSLKILNSTQFKPQFNYETILKLIDLKYTAKQISEFMKCSIGLVKHLGSKFKKSIRNSSAPCIKIFKNGQLRKICFGSAAAATWVQQNGEFIQYTQKTLTEKIRVCVKNQKKLGDWEFRLEELPPISDLLNTPEELIIKKLVKTNN